MIFFNLTSENFGSHIYYFSFSLTQIYFLVYIHILKNAAVGSFRSTRSHYPTDTGSHSSAGYAPRANLVSLVVFTLERPIASP